MFAIVDIETTGGNTSGEKITEIAIYRFDGNNIVDEFCTLINPCKKIPYFIAKMTGIDDKMVSHAPKFHEVAKRIVEITDNAIFVAHNAKFDFGFIRREFKNLGYDYKREILCTVNASRKVIPGKQSYSLGKLCTELGIEINNRHRASGDALATVELVKHLITVGGTHFYKISEVKTIQHYENINPNIIEQLPSDVGVYYFYNSQDKPLYIGKSLNIKDRVYTHLRNRSKRSIEMCSSVASITYELTGSELIALLKESHEIKEFKPVFNRAQRRSIFNYGVFSKINDKGYIEFEIQNTSQRKKPLIAYSSLSEAKQAMTNIAEKFNLCQKLCGLYQTNGACFQSLIEKCNGACIGKETPESYNLRVDLAIKSLDFSTSNFIIFDTGRTADETSFVMVENSKYIGFGYCITENLPNDTESLKDFLLSYSDNKDVKNIIKYFVLKKKYQKLVYF